MNEVLAIAAAGMDQDSARLQSIAHNLANVSTNGFKRDIVTKAPLMPVFDQHMAVAGMQPTEMTKVTDQRAGAFRPTGNPLDLAIEGTGFFELNTPNGLAYTRAGVFRMDAQGQLINEAGYPVMGAQGPIVLSSSEPTIDHSGHVFEKDKLLAQLKLVSFADVSALNYLGNGLYDAQSAQTDNATASSRVRQGFVEASNVSSMQEMVKLVETMRHFESMQKVVQGWDDANDVVIRKLGEF